MRGRGGVEAAVDGREIRGKTTPGSSISGGDRLAAMPEVASERPNRRSEPRQGIAARSSKRGSADRTMLREATVSEQQQHHTTPSNHHRIEEADTARSSCGSRWKSR